LVITGKAGKVVTLPLAGLALARACAKQAFV
jgi:hypothetical protein